jgi:hypothetical protein
MGVERTSRGRCQSAARTQHDISAGSLPLAAVVSLGAGQWFSRFRGKSGQCATIKSCPEADIYFGSLATAHIQTRSAAFAGHHTSDAHSSGAGRATRGLVVGG